MHIALMPSEVKGLVARASMPLDANQPQHVCRDDLGRYLSFNIMDGKHCGNNDNVCHLLIMHPQGRYAKLIKKPQVSLGP